MYYLYILECNDGSLYTGITTDVARRLKEHKDKIGAHYTRSRGARNIRYTELFATRSAASKREFEIKNWRRAKKLTLIKNGPPNDG